MIKVSKWKREVKKIKVKGTALLRGVYTRCSSHFSGHEPVCDAWPVRRQTYGYLPGG